MAPFSQTGACASRGLRSEIAEGRVFEELLRPSCFELPSDSWNGPMLFHVGCPYRVTSTQKAGRKHGDPKVDVMAPVSSTCLTFRCFWSFSWNDIWSKKEIADALCHLSLWAVANYFAGTKVLPVIVDPEIKKLSSSNNFTCFLRYTWHESEAEVPPESFEVPENMFTEAVGPSKNAEDHFKGEVLVKQKTKVGECFFTEYFYFGGSNGEISTEPGFELKEVTKPKPSSTWAQGNPGQCCWPGRVGLTVLWSLHGQAKSLGVRSTFWGQSVWTWFSMENARTYRVALQFWSSHPCSYSKMIRKVRWTSKHHKHQ